MCIGLTNAPTCSMFLTDQQVTATLTVEVATTRIINQGYGLIPPKGDFR
jgi:hypothetical protein